MYVCMSVCISVIPNNRQEPLDTIMAASTTRNIQILTLQYSFMHALFKVFLRDLQQSIGNLNNKNQIFTHFWLTFKNDL